MARIGILLVATGQYRQLLPNVIKSIEERFLCDKVRRLYVFTDDVDYVTSIRANYPKISDFIITKIARRGSPGDTLYRYKYFLLQKAELEKSTDVLYYLDVDMYVNEVITDVILPTKEKPLIAVIHPGMYYVKDKIVYSNAIEKSSASTAYIAPTKYQKEYVCGGFNGGLTKDFLEMSTVIDGNIDIDDRNEVIAIWHDESHLNKYYSENSGKFRILTPEYVYSENALLEKSILHRKIIALDKHFADNEVYVTIDLVGGIGNMLFQIATAYSYALDNNMTFAMDLLVTGYKTAWKGKRGGSYRHSTFSNILRTDIKKKNWNTYKERNFLFNKILTKDIEYMSIDTVIKNAPHKGYYVDKNLIKNYKPEHVFTDICGKQYVEEYLIGGHKIVNSGNSKSCEYCKQVFTVPKHLKLVGYFQSYKYFHHHRDKIVNLLTNNYKPQISSFFTALKTQYKECTNYVSLHIRRTDYTQYKDIHHNLPITYYQNAVNQFKKENTVFIIFSDDIAYCKTLPLLKTIKTKFIDQNEPDEYNIFLMASCHSNIIANSTFSWWGAYLNNNSSKIVVVPNRWFGHKGPGFSMKDFYPYDWNIKIINAN